MMVNGEMKLFLVAFVMMISTSQAYYWTSWFDFDNPSGAGDYERITDHPTANTWRPCGGRKNVWIKARVKGQSAEILTRDSLVVGPKYGLYCSYAVSSGPCTDYAVRYHGLFQTSNWIDLDDPPADDERAFQVNNLPLFIQYIHFKTQGYRVSYRVDQKIKLSPRYGLRCKNVDQTGGPCKDYEVRYYCGGYPDLHIKASA